MYWLKMMKKTANKAKKETKVKRKSNIFRKNSFLLFILLLLLRKI